MGGVFFAALKGNRESEETKIFREGYIAILRKYAGPHFDRTKEHSHLDIVKHLFENVTEKSFYVDENYTVRDALMLIQSLSLWNRVSETNKSKMLIELKKFYENNLIDGFVVRKREIFTFAATKNAKHKTHNP